MAQTRASQRIRTWTGRSGRAIPYGPFARVSDWWCAGRDAKKRLPDLAPQQSGPIAVPPPRSEPDGAAVQNTTWLATPRMLALSELGRGRMEAEWIKYKAEVHDELPGAILRRASG